MSKATVATFTHCMSIILNVHNYLSLRRIANAQYMHTQTRSVTAGFGRHGMPPPASNDTGTAFCLPN